MTITVHVTKEIIREAMYCDGKKHFIGTSCALALAIRDIFPNCFIGVGRWWPVQSKDCYCYTLPPAASAFVKHFDKLSSEQRLLMDPISFEIDVPSEVIDQIGISQVYKILSESRTLELAVKYDTI